MQSDNGLMPGSPELEEAFIGSAMMSTAEEWLGCSARLVDAECFTRPLWATCWAAITDAWSRGAIVDPVSLSVEADVDLCDLLDALTGAPCEHWHLPTRAKALRELAMRRKLIAFGGDMARNAYSEPDTEGQIAYVQAYAEMLDDLRAREEDGDMATIADEVEKAADGGMAGGWKSGLRAYDEWSGGLRPGEVHVIGGASGVGKSWVLCEFANAMADKGLRSCFFSLEMSKAQLYARLVSCRIGTKTAWRLLGRGKTWSASERDDYRLAREVLEPSVRQFQRQRSLAEIATAVRQHQPHVFFVDYIQLMDAPPNTRGSYEAATANATGLQRLAMKADACCVLATQMSREAIRAGTNSAIQGGAESGRIDQIADVWVQVSGVDAGEAGGIKLTPRKIRNEGMGTPQTYRLDTDNGGLVEA